MRSPNGLITAVPTAHAIHQVETRSKMETLIVLGAAALITQHALPFLATCKSVSFTTPFSYLTSSLFAFSFCCHNFPFFSLEIKLASAGTGKRTLTMYYLGMWKSVLHWFVSWNTLILWVEKTSKWCFFYIYFKQDCIYLYIWMCWLVVSELFTIYLFFGLKQMVSKISPLSGELWLTCRERNRQVSCLLVRINSCQHQSHYVHPLQPPVLLVQ